MGSVLPNSIGGYMKLNEYNINVFGVPIPKARARTISKGGRVWSFTPSSSKAWEEAIQLQVKTKAPKEPSVRPLGVELYFNIPRPKVGVCALNPHGGEGGIFGKEEAGKIAPAGYFFTFSS